ncbi:MAG: hypothetical protein LBC35_06220 [Coriobacteriales bacterium]|nr:hypothetical protein [Coriobacteriales bacterium]
MINLEIFQPLIDAIAAAFDFVISLLPQSPLLTQQSGLNLSAVSHYLGWVNYFIPFDICVGLFSGWLSVLGLTLVARAILRYFGFLG